jgi:hypothetical protein
MESVSEWRDYVRTKEQINADLREQALLESAAFSDARDIADVFRDGRCHLIGNDGHVIL